MFKISSSLPIIKARIDLDACSKDHKCLPQMHCPSAAIIVNKEVEGKMSIVEDKCIGCGKCTKVCVNGAIFLERLQQNISRD